MSEEDFSDKSDDISAFSDLIEETEKSDSEDETETKDSSRVRVIDSVKTSNIKRINKSKKIKYIYAPSPGEKDKRISPKRMSKFEYTRLIGERAEMISKGSPIHPKYSDIKVFDLLEIARLELNDRSIPFPINIYRPIGDPINPKVIEVFNPHEPGFLSPVDLLSQYIDKYEFENSWRVI